MKTLEKVEPKKTVPVYDVESGLNTILKNLDFILPFFFIFSRNLHSEFLVILLYFTFTRTRKDLVGRSYGSL